MPDLGFHTMLLDSNYSPAITEVSSCSCCVCRIYTLLYTFSSLESFVIILLLVCPVSIGQNLSWQMLVETVFFFFGMLFVSGFGFSSPVLLRSNCFAFVICATVT